MGYMDDRWQRMTHISFVQYSMHVLSTAVKLAVLPMVNMSIVW